MYSTRRVLTFFCEAKNASSLASKLKLAKQSEALFKSVISFPEMSEDIEMRVLTFFYEVKNTSPLRAS